MAIIAENKGGSNYKPVEAGSYPARCYSMVHIGTIPVVWEGQSRMQNKVRLTWELPSELHVFNIDKGEQPYVISQEFTLSMHEKSSLRKVLESWRGKSFTDEDAKKFDITKLIGVECLLSVIHKEKDGNKYASISGISRLPKGLSCPPQINEIFIFSYDEKFPILQSKLSTLPEFLQTKIKSSQEWKSIENPQHTESGISEISDLPESDDLPF